MIVRLGTFLFRTLRRLEMRFFLAKIGIYPFFRRSFSPGTVDALSKS
jgi:hypothetical protein